MRNKFNTLFCLAVYILYLDLTEGKGSKFELYEMCNTLGVRNVSSAVMRGALRTHHSKPSTRHTGTPRVFL
jgi:hypothetical protein